VVVEHHLERRNERGVVLQRLAHPHHHDVGDRAFAFAEREAAAQLELGVPELGDDLGGRQVAAEALVAGRAEAAVDGAARLRRDAERATTGLGDEDGLDGIAAADVEQPLDRAVLGDLLARDRKPSDFGAGDELLAKRFREIGHRREVARAALVDPAKQLRRAKRLLALLLAPVAECVAVELEEVYHRDARQRLCRSMPGKKNATSVAAVSAASEPCTALASMLAAKSARIVPRSAFFGSVAPISSRFFAIADSPSRAWTITGPDIMNETRSPKNGRARWTA